MTSPYWLTIALFLENQPAHRPFELIVVPYPTRDACYAAKAAAEYQNLTDAMAWPVVVETHCMSNGIVEP
jgi:hypothetical protein